MALQSLGEHLVLHGLPPDRELTGFDADIWAEAMDYASAIRWIVPPAGVPADELTKDLAAMEAAWNLWEGFVTSLPEGFCKASRSLAQAGELGESLAELFRPQAIPTAIIG